MLDRDARGSKKKLQRKREIVHKLVSVLLPSFLLGALLLLLFDLPKKRHFSADLLPEGSLFQSPFQRSNLTERKGCLSSSLFLN